MKLSSESVLHGHLEEQRKREPPQSGEVPLSMPLATCSLEQMAVFSAASLQAERNSGTSKPDERSGRSL